MTDNICKLTGKKAERLIRRIVEKGLITPTDHFYEMMRKRNYDFQDVVLVLSKGKVKGPPEYDRSFNNWKYRIEGYAVGGDKTVVVAAIMSHNELVCITIFDK